MEAFLQSVCLDPFPPSLTRTIPVTSQSTTLPHAPYSPASVFQGDLPKCKSCLHTSLLRILLWLPIALVKKFQLLTKTSEQCVNCSSLASSLPTLPFPGFRPDLTVLSVSKCFTSLSLLDLCTCCPPAWISSPLHLDLANCHHAQLKRLLGSLP